MPNLDRITDRYRPRTLAELAGQDHIKEALRGIGRTPPPCVLLYGPRGTGKTSTARIIAASANCDELLDGEPCGTCPSCITVRMKNGLALLEVDAARSGSVDDIRYLADKAQYVPSARWRIIVIDEVQAVSSIQAFSALLGALEEPPERCTFILVTTDEQKLPDTIRSRAMSFEFRALAPFQIVARLLQIVECEQMKVPSEVLEDIALRSDGAMRDAVILLQQAWCAGVQTVEGLAALKGPGYRARHLLQAAVNLDPPTAGVIIGAIGRRVTESDRLIEGLGELLGDLWCITGGGKSQADSESERLARGELASQLTSEGIYRMGARVAGFGLRADRTWDGRGRLWMVFVSLVEALSADAGSAA